MSEPPAAHALIPDQSSRLVPVLRGLWARLAGRSRDHAVAREIEREHMSPAERHRTAESIEDIQADESAAEHLGGVEPDRLLDE